MVRILEYLGKSGHDTLQGISKGAGVPRTSLIGILEVLEDAGYVRRVDQVRFALGFRLLALGRTLLTGLDLPREALQEMQALTASLHQTCHMGVLDGGEVVYIQKVESDLSIKMASRIGLRVPCYSTSLGKILLAWLPEEQREAAIAQQSFQKRVPNTITSAAALRKELARVKARGYAVDDEENEASVRCVAAPVYDHSGQVVAAISISGLVTTLPKEKVAEVAEEVVATAQAISHRMGFASAAG